MKEHEKTIRFVCEDCNYNMIMGEDDVGTNAGSEPALKIRRCDFGNPEAGDRLLVRSLQRPRSRELWVSLRLGNKRRPWTQRRVCEGRRPAPWL